MIRIAIVEPTDRVGGAEISAMDLAEHVDPNQFYLEFVLPGISTLSRALQKKKIPFQVMPQPDFASVRYQFSNQTSVINPFAIIYDLIIAQKYAAAIAKSARINKWDLIQGNGIFGNFVATFAARRANLSCIWHVQDMVSPTWGKGLGRRYLAFESENVRQVVAISQAVAKSLSGIIPSKIRVIYHGVNERRFNPSCKSSLRSELGLGNEIFVVGTLARLVPWKGHTILLEAAARAMARQPNLHFVIIGDAVFGEAAYKEQLMQSARQLKIDKRVSFLGWRDDTANVLAGIDVLVHPVIKPEPFGIALIEAMAMAKPVITSNLGGPVEIVADKDTGFLIPPNDAGVLADVISRLAQQPQFATEMGRRARQRVLENFTIARNARMFEALYLTLVNSE